MSEDNQQHIEPEEKKPEHKKREALAMMVDRKGNQLIRYDNGAYTLKLISENGRERQIGLLVDRTMFVERKDNHYFHKAHGYGFNYLLLKRSTVFDFVMITHNSDQYKVPRQTILDFGKVLEFKEAQDGNSFEIQTFLSFDIIKKYKQEVSI